ncbi:MAG: hypothetical protein RL518_2341 [Pseudomonadota bacterium]|jgi:N-acetylglutamate synthase-like GNAT family acetyltransferase
MLKKYSPEMAEIRSIVVHREHRGDGGERASLAEAIAQARER